MMLPQTLAFGSFRYIGWPTSNLTHVWKALSRVLVNEFDGFGVKKFEQLPNFLNFFNNFVGE